jgi:ferredoxin-type protein NapH
VKFPVFSHKLPFTTVRHWLVQPFCWALFFITPWVNAFRVDMLDQQVWFMGQAYPFSMQTLQWIPIGFYLGVLIIAVTSLLLGRWFCGWSCPHNSLTEWTRPLRQLVGREPLSNGLKRLKRFNPNRFKALQWLAPFVGLALPVVLAFSLVGYVVPPYWQLAQWASGHPHIALVFGHGLFTLIGVFLLVCGHDFCRTCCPYGMGQSISAYTSGGWLKPMEIAFTQPDTTGCNSCTACQQICPVDIDPRHPQNLHVGQFEGCFNCGACVDACHWIHQNQPDPKNKVGWLRFAPPHLRKKQPI